MNTDNNNQMIKKEENLFSKIKIFLKDYFIGNQVLMKQL